MAESSVSGALWSDLYYLYFAVAAVVGGLVVAWLFYNMWAFRWRPDRVRPADAPIAGTIIPERGHPLWSYAMAGLIALIMFGLAFGTISAIQTLETPEENARYYNVTGYQFGWRYAYVGEGGLEFQVTTPGREIPYFPVDTPIVFNITSQDVWHNFAIPDYRIRVDAIPGTVNPLWFRATETGEVRNVCVVICGVNHAAMHTMMKVVTPEEYEAWLEETTNARYQRMIQDFARPGRGTAVNVTATDAGVDLERANVTAGRPVVFNVTNEGSSPVRMAVGQNEIEVQPGEFGYLYALAPREGTLVLAANGEEQTLEVSE